MRINNKLVNEQAEEYYVLSTPNNTFGGAKVQLYHVPESEWEIAIDIKNPIEFPVVDPTVLNQIEFTDTEHKYDPRILREPATTTQIHDFLKYDIRLWPNERLNNMFDRLPYGILDKRVTGIGATTLELNSPRNSIIVVPTKALAHNKAVKFPNSRYIGSAIEGKQRRFSSRATKDYLEDNSISYKKFIVVADSLPKLLEVIGEDHYDDYFLMIDKIDMVQSDSTFRPAMENLIDYYFEFDYKNRALVSATFRISCHPQLRKEPWITVTYKEMPRLTISELLTTNNPDAALKATIEQLIQAHPDQKIVIAYNSILQIQGIINWLPSDLQSQCSILCSEASKDKAGRYYGEIQPGDSLPSQINFITCAYFSGIDLNERFHLITVSNTIKPYTLLSPAQYIQIAGRCRAAEGLLSYTVIYDSQPQTPQHPTLQAYYDHLKQKAESILTLYNTMEKLRTKMPDLNSIFDILTSALVQRGTEAIANEDPIPIIRRDTQGRPQIAYFNIDSLLERYTLRNTLYCNPQRLSEWLQDTQHVVNCNTQTHAIRAEQRAAFSLAKEQHNTLYADQLNRTIEELRPLCENNSFPAYLLANIEQNAQRYGAKFLTYFNKLRPYIDPEILLEELQERLRGNKTDTLELTNYANAVIFRALADDHPFKILIRNAFTINQRYTPTEILDLLRPTFENQHLGTIQDTSVAIKYLRRFFTTQRGRSRQGAYYKIKRLYAEEINPEDTPSTYIDSSQNIIDWFECNY